MQAVLKKDSIVATMRIIPLHIGKSHTESQASSHIIDYAINSQKTNNGPLVTALHVAGGEPCRVFADETGVHW